VHEEIPPVFRCNSQFARHSPLQSEGTDDVMSRASLFSSCCESLQALRTAPRLPQPGPAHFSTSTARYASVVKKKGMVSAPKKGVKSLNTKKGKKAATGDAGKKPGQGERKALRKRIVLSNNNALEVSSLRDLDKKTALSAQHAGQVVGVPADVVDALRAVEAFKTTQGWSLFRRPAVLMRKEAMQLAALLTEVEAAQGGPQQRSLRRILSGERMSGKSTLLLQGLTMAFLRGWFVINLPEGKHTVSWRERLR
jgi:small subunit ribosomal protein S29